MRLAIVKVPVTGTDKFNILKGTDLSDTITGGQGSDIIYGGQGSDWLYAGSGKDTLDGGTGKDFLSGGNGADVFVYHQAADAGFGAQCDVITDFKSGDDKINVHDFMAGGQFIGAAAFSIGQGPAIRYTQATGLLEGDVNGDGVADFQIQLSNNAAILATDFTF